MLLPKLSLKSLYSRHVPRSQQSGPAHSSTSMYPLFKLQDGLVPFAMLEIGLREIEINCVSSAKGEDEARGQGGRGEERLPTNDRRSYIGPVGSQKEPKFFYPSILWLIHMKA